MPKKVMIFPVNSLILYDLVSRFGHQPLAMMSKIAEKVRDPEVDSPPINITYEEPRHGLKYCAVEVPSGVRGRMALLGPLIEEAEAAIIVDDPDIEFGCSGCARTNELVIQMLHNKGIPILRLKYPRSSGEARDFVKSIVDFLKSIDGGAS
ncbi:MAG: methanogenesis marker 5 protein [Candidatus Nezhaarchaeota archaeon]|nr:methanogenesis marker 5 protein [Candidatus Nezhaarchaeota archaeon]